MQTIDRRFVLGGLAALSLVGPAQAATSEELHVDTDEGSMVMTRYAATHPGKRPGVLVLHGSHGIEFRLRAYERYADALTAEGIDTYFLRYFTTADDRALNSKESTPGRHHAYNVARFEDWSKRTSSAVTTILARPDHSGRIGLLGFSLGGYIAADTAAHDARVAALAVLYGGMPDAVVPHVKHLPPLIELHGDADRNVPLAKGEELVKLGKALGVEAKLVTYPGKAHGFDFSDTDPLTADAIGRVARFFQSRLFQS